MVAKLRILFRNIIWAMLPALSFAPANAVTFHDLSAANTSVACEIPVWQGGTMGDAFKLDCSAFFAGLPGLTTAAAFRAAIAAATGPGSSTSGNVATFNGTDGKTLADGGKSAASLVTGPSSATADAVASFNGTTGKVIKDSTKALPTGVIVGTTDTQTLTNKALTSPTVTTQTAGDNTTKAASTAFVQTAVGGNPAFVADRNGSDQGSLSANATNLVQLTHAAEDNKSWFDTTNKRYTPQKAGLYHVEGACSVTFTGTAGDSPQAYIYKSGSLALNGVYSALPSVASGATSVVSGSVRLNGSSDYVDLRCFVPTNGTAIRGGASGTYISGFRVAD